MSPVSGAKLAADVSVKPTRSQVFLVALIVLCGLSLLCGAGMLVSAKQEGWWFFAFSACTLALASYGWFRSQSDTDLEQAQPTQVTFSDGTKFSTDTRMLRSEEGVTAIIRAVEGILHRRPLPEPDGLLDQNFAVIRDSTKAAKDLVGSINADTQKITNQLGSALGLSYDCPHELHEVPASSQSAPTTPPNKVDVNLAIQHSPGANVETVAGAGIGSR